MFANDPQARKRWARRLEHKLNRGKLEALLRTLREFPPPNPELARLLANEAEYFERNTERMRYPRLRAQGLFIGSGVVEAGCKTVVGARLKQSGMFRTVRGANAILALRCNRLSGKFENYWESRALGCLIFHRYVAHPFERWRRGIPRFREEHPYVALLISLHAYSLHAPRVGAESDPAFLHPLFGDPGDWPAPEGDELEEARQFVGEQHVLQELLSDRIRNDPQWSAAVEPWRLRPHTRLLQLCDALSLHLCFGADKERTLANIPRKNWEDRVSLHVRPVGDRRVAIDP